MSTKKKGQLTQSPERHKHLRKFLRKLFWSRERVNEKKDIDKKLNQE